MCDVHFSDEEVAALTTPIDSDNSSSTSDRLMQDTLQDTLLGYSKINRIFRNTIAILHTTIAKTRLDISQNYCQLYKHPLRVLSAKSRLLGKIMAESEQTSHVIETKMQLVRRKAYELKVLSSGKVCELLSRIEYGDVSSSGGVYDVKELEAELRMEKNAYTKIE